MHEPGNHTLIYNHASSGFPLSNNAANAFINQIRAQLNAGYRFTPFIGAGFSAPSGAPLIWELKAYLERCIGLALGIEEPGSRAWNPRADAWPPFHDPGRVAITNWLERVKNEFERRQRLEKDDELPIFQEAIGAMAEWRTSLLFLSRLVRERPGNGFLDREIAFLDAPSQDVIDTGLREIMHGKKPTLGHRMLAVLAGLLRLNIIITTNFDELLEEAFEAARNPLLPHNVELSTGLPAAASLMRARSILKLHGTGFSLRADYSLDALPSDQDRWRFVEYLTTDDGRKTLADNLRQGKPTGRLPCSSHLLMMGVSASERRTRSFIEHAWRHLDAPFKVFLALP